MLRKISADRLAGVGRDASCDVIVIGGGAAGLAAAVSAGERGMRTILLERRDKLGGSTAISIGSFTAAGTAWQRRKGITDSPAALLEDMAIIPGVSAHDDAPQLRAILAAEAAPALAWLAAMGIPFVGPFPEAPHRVPRMHNVVPDSRMYIACLERAARRLGVAIMTSACARELICDAAGSVTGVIVDIGGVERTFHAENAVILATGDFSGNGEMRREYLSAAAAQSVPANPESTGDGHRLALALGAQLRKMEISTGPKLRFRPAAARGIVAHLPLQPWLMRPLAALVQVLPRALLRPFIKSLLVAHMQPSLRLFEAGAILVNMRGERFCDETRSTLALAHQPDAAGYIVFDAAIAGQFNQHPNFVSTAPGVGYAFMRDYERARPDLVHRADTAGGLARLLSVDPTRLERSLTSATSKLGVPLCALGPVVSTLTVTEGGAAVDGQCRVQRQDGSCIPGLFAAGGVAQGGMRLSGHGLHIGWAVVSGRIAGQAAAHAVPHSQRMGAWKESAASV